jgi:Ni/Co efflux regulator RcnB
MAAEHEDEDEVLIDNKKRKINKRLEKMHEMAAEHEVEDEVLIDNNKKKIKKYTRWRRSTRLRTRCS